MWRPKTVFREQQKWNSTASNIDVVCGEKNHQLLLSLSPRIFGQFKCSCICALVSWCPLLFLSLSSFHCCCCCSSICWILIFILIARMRFACTKCTTLFAAFNPVDSSCMHMRGSLFYFCSTTEKLILSLPAMVSGFSLVPTPCSAPSKSLSTNTNIQLASLSLALLACVCVLWEIA